MCVCIAYIISIIFISIGYLLPLICNHLHSICLDSLSELIPYFGLLIPLQRETEWESMRMNGSIDRKAHHSQIICKLDYSRINITSNETLKQRHETKNKYTRQRQISEISLYEPQNVLPKNSTSSETEIAFDFLVETYLKHRIDLHFNWALKINAN